MKTRNPTSISCNVARESVPNEQCETNSDFAELRSERVRGDIGWHRSRLTTGNRIRILENTDTRSKSLSDQATGFIS